MKQFLITFISLFIGFVSSAQEYTFTGKLLDFYDNHLKTVAATIPADNILKMNSYKFESDAKVVTNSNPSISAWTNAQNIHATMVDSQERTDPFKELEKAAANNPATAILYKIISNPIGKAVTLVVLLLLMLTVPVLTFCGLLFLIMFVFKFDTLTMWFNKRAGMTIAPDSRLSSKLLYFLLLILVIGAAYMILALMPNSTGAILGIGLAIVSLIAFITFRTMYLGRCRAAIWEFIYIVYAGYSIFFLATLLWWALLIFIAFKLLTDDSTKKCCCNCVHYGPNGYCSAHNMFVRDNTRACSKYQ